MLVSDIIQALTPISIICGIVFGYSLFRRNQKQDDNNENSRINAFGYKLETISNQLTEMKAEFKAEFNALKSDAKLDHDDLIVLKRDVKTLFNKFDEIKR